MMSGASGTNFNMMSDLVADNTAMVANTVGCNPSATGPQEVLECLRRVPLRNLMNTSVSLARRLRPPLGELSFYPSYDGDYIPTRPSILLRQGSFVQGNQNPSIPKAPMLIVNCKAFPSLHPG